MLKLPLEAARLMGIETYPYMKLVEPMYGQVDAPREWFIEASRRLIDCSFVSHPLDQCFHCF